MNYNAVLRAGTPSGEPARLEAMEGRVRGRSRGGAALQGGMLHVQGGICDAKGRRRAYAGGEMQPLRRTKILSVSVIRALRFI